MDPRVLSVVLMAILLSARAAAALSVLAVLGTAPAWSACVTGAGGGGGGAHAMDASGAIGVVDMLTASSSVCVGGLEIHYDNATPVTVNGRRAHVSQLEIGQVVAIEARAAAGQLTARDIAILRVLEGPVTRIDPDTRRVLVMGQVVRVTDDTMMPEQEQLAALGPGATVEVSGYRNAHGEVIASRIDIAPPRSGHSVIGRMKQRDARTGEIGGLLVYLASDMRMEKESDVLVRGLWDGGQLRAGTLAEDPSVDLMSRVERAVVESLVLESMQGDLLRVGEHQVRIGRQTRFDPAARALRIDQRVRVTGALDGRRAIAAERIEVPPPASARTQSVADRRPGSAEKARADNSPASTWADRIERPEPALAERSERAERERAERLERERVERAERERLERLERERVERAERERVERLERERVERAESARIERFLSFGRRSGGGGGD
jgi:hypothetical protein